MAAQGANNHCFHAIDMTKMMMQMALIMRLTCIITRACFFSLGKVIMPLGGYEFRKS